MSYYWKIFVGTALSTRPENGYDRNRTTIHSFGVTMENYHYWLIAGFVLVITELVTGTFYLLVIGIAAFVAAVAAYLGAGLWVQAIIASVVLVVGVALVSQRKLGAPDASGVSGG